MPYYTHGSFLRSDHLENITFWTKKYFDAQAAGDTYRTALAKEYVEYHEKAA